jgi:hypothetical protein
MSVYLEWRLSHKLLILDTKHPEMHVHMSKDVRIRDYFSEQKGSAKKKVWAILHYTSCE